MKLSEIKGIGTKTEILLNKVGINSLDDLVTHYPFRYDILKRTNITAVESDDKIIIDGKVESIPILIRFKAGLNKLNVRIATIYGAIGVSIFNRAFLKANLKIGTNIIVIGKYDKKRNIITASDIKFGVLSNKETIEPVYHTTNGLTTKTLLSYINNALMKNGNDINDSIPKYLLDKYNFNNKKTSLNIIHNPPNFEKLKEASLRLKYEELFEFMFKINYLKQQNKIANKGISRTCDRTKFDKLLKKLPFDLTDDQKKSLNEIIEDLKSNNRMNRLLQGDVGSGKTIVAFLSMCYNAFSGYQSALMAPTEILAVQHYNNLKELIDDSDIEIVLLTGSINKKEKKNIYDKLKNGDIDIIIGTHALIQEDVLFNNLGLVITDEQHRFGVNQRTNLKNKGVSVDVLYMSATPIPRTYALTIYGDMDISSIKQLPSGRKKVTTILKNENEIKDVLGYMYEELKNNHQIYVIAPLIEQNDNTDLTSVYNLRDKMNLAFGSKYNIDIVHGKMKPEVKELIMEEFKQNKINILISTTVIEVGVDVKNATMIVIFDANRFGLSTLHQLRGRVGRNSFESKCILISNSDAERLKIMESVYDGFEISEKDFKLRGSGDLFGVKQSGDMTFKIANLQSDYKILLQAKKDSMEFLKGEQEIELKERLISTIEHS
ncbi:MAG: ATP-dependent DNA helicase RecG [bacterium]|nr:ATP-dependent DNA helicase RecG [bacterium]